MHDDPILLTYHQIKGLEMFIKSRKEDPRLVHCHFYEPPKKSNGKRPDMPLDVSSQDGAPNREQVQRPADGKHVTFAPNLPKREPKYAGAIDIPKPPQATSSRHPYG